MCEGILGFGILRSMYFPALIPSTTAWFVDYGVVIVLLGLLTRTHTYLSPVGNHKGGEIKGAYI